MSHDSHDHHHEKHHDHSHDHGHSHGHHHPAPKNFDAAFVTALLLNSIFVAIEFGYGFFANSTALMADAGHNLSDVLGLILAWTATILARKTPSQRYTYGLRSSSILAALANAMFLLVACGAIAWEAVLRIAQPPEVAGFTVSAVAVIGIIVNGISAWLFMKGSKDDLNIRGAYLHMAADAAVSLGVAIAGIAIVFTGWNWLDPTTSLIIVVVIVVGTWSLLREATQLALHAVPTNIDTEKVEKYLRNLSGVSDIHDLHIWGLSTTESALTVHLIMPGGHPSDAFMDGITQELKEHFNIHHCTLQIGQGSTNHSCVLNEVSDDHKDNS
jgi:cobalt-zinc-cadmium efflux system protein